MNGDGVGGEYRFIKDLVFDLVRKSSGRTGYEEVTAEVRKQFPHSAWKETHWAWYKSQIVTGKYAAQFSDEIRKNLRLQRYSSDEVQEPPQEELFTWLPFFQEMLTVMCEKYDKQTLCEVFHEVFADAGGTQDNFADGTTGPLQEIDPLTFIGYFNRQIKEARRVEYCKVAKQVLGLSSDPPSDFDSIPTLNNQQAWFFSYARSRGDHDIDNLWKFSKALNDLTITNELFSSALEIRNVGVPKLTQLMFICKPKTFISIDKTNRSYFRSQGIHTPTSDFKEPSNGYDLYRGFVDEVKTHYVSKTCYEISYDAYRYREDEPSEDTGGNYWAIAPGENARLWNDFQNNKIVAVGCDKLGDISQYSDSDTYRAKIQELYQPKNKPTNDAKMCFDFAHRMKIGDIVFAKKGRTQLLGYGKVKSDLIYDPSREEYHNTRLVEWIVTENWEVPPGTKLPVKTLTDITNQKDLIEAYGQLIKTPPEEVVVEIYTESEAMKDLFIGKETFEKIIGLLKHKHNIILQGAPGVGKTFIAKRLAYYLIGYKDEAKVEMIQFHQSYSYEDFIQGYRPDDNGGFSLQNGVFYDFCMKAQDDPQSKYVFIIDEINRGNLSKIFGELMMLVESDKRGKEFAIPLTYAKTADARFHIPENIYFIGTMNTADRSLAMVDYALRRRFAFMVLQPHFTKRFKRFLLSKEVSEKTIDLIHGKMTKLNDTIRNDNKNLGPGYCIGHSFFCPKGRIEDEKKWLGLILDHEIKPLIDEYWFDNEEKAGQIRQQLDS